MIAKLSAEKSSLIFILAEDKYVNHNDQNVFSR